MKSGQCYKISNVALKGFSGTKYSTLTKNNTINEADRLRIDWEEVVLEKKQQIKLQFPPEGIN